MLLCYPMGGEGEKEEFLEKKRTVLKKNLIASFEGTNLSYHHEKNWKEILKNQREDTF